MNLESLSPFISQFSITTDGSNGIENAREKKVSKVAIPHIEELAALKTENTELKHQIRQLEKELAKKNITEMLEKRSGVTKITLHDAWTQNLTLDEQCKSDLQHNPNTIPLTREAVEAWTRKTHRSSLDGPEIRTCDPCCSIS
jgi:hypothetical protein